jgi:DNA-binding response OmpR family regulator
MMMERATRGQIDMVLTSAEREMLDTLIHGELVPTSAATRVRVCHIRRALALLSPDTVIICARGVGYTLRKLEA